MAPTYTSGNSYAGTQSFEGKWAGTSFFPENTLKYFDFYFKGKQSENTGYMPNELLFEALTTNSPDIKVLDVERRNLDSETMGAIINCLLGNTQVTELKIAGNASFWSEQPDDLGNALAAVLSEKNNITSVDIGNNDIQEECVGKIMEALKTNTKVKTLNMRDNFSRGRGADIADMLNTNKTLTSLNLNVNQLEDKDCELVLAAVDRSTTLKYFSAYNNAAISKETRKKLRGFNKL